MFQYLVECLNSSILLRFIWCTLLMLDLKFLCNCANNAIYEVAPLVAHQYLGITKLSNHIVK